ncbi:serine/threonine-protein kinase [Citreicoccus inhibens]|uniref:serine/threonine-protein kinase n=1 Tax=Citreicoccus inhibens TaxID=2849499 RepID=UPI002E2DC93E|nr:protein kinase [Citreicoccus inhibens]
MSSGSTQAVEELREGSMLGAYQLERLLGEGSMGRVYQARHAKLGRQVALKVLRADHARDSTFVQRFFQEARTVNQINHEHIVEIFDFVDEGAEGRVYCVMELLRGQSLATLLKSEPITLARIQRIAVQVCTALGAAHQVGVVHRDIKPDNLFIIQRGGQPDFVKVLDFGVAKLMAAQGGVSSTLDGTIIGTPAYMSPEQAAGLPVDHRADIYAVGNILYELVVGHPPFESTAFGQLVVQIITQAPPALPATLPSGEPLPAEFSELVMRCLAKEPEARPQQLAEVTTALLLLRPVFDDASLDGGRRPSGEFVRVDRATPALGTASLSLGSGVPDSTLAETLDRAQPPRDAAAPRATPAGLPALVAATEVAGSPGLPPGLNAPVGGEAAERASATGLPAARSPWPTVLSNRRMALGLAVLALVVSVGALAWRGMKGRAAPESAPAVVAMAAPVPALASVPTSVAAVPPPPAESAALITLKVSSFPQGAHVMRSDTGELLGLTPLVTQVPREGALLGLRVELSGYMSLEREVRLDASEAELVVPLVKARPAPRPPPAPARQPPARKGARRTVVAPAASHGAR